MVFPRKAFTPVARILSVGVMSASIVLAGVSVPAQAESVRGKSFSQLKREEAARQAAAARRAAIAKAKARALAQEKARIANAKAQGIDLRCLKYARVICVSTKSRKVRLLVKGKVVQTLDARFGRRGMASPKGVYTVYKKQRFAWSFEYGVRLPFTLMFHPKRHTYIHFSDDFARVGYRSPGSHGCINLRSWAGARWLFDNTPKGTPVVIY